MTGSNSTFRGIIYMLGYVLLFIATNAVTKVMAVSLPLVQVATFRYAFAVPAILLVFVLSSKEGVRIADPRVHVGRGMLAAAGSLCGYYAISKLSLGDATSLFFLAPLLVTAGAAFFLRERAGMVRMLCIAGGFAGVVLIAQPHLGGIAGILAGLGNAACAASGVLLVRFVRNREGALSLALTTSAVCTAILVPPTIFVWTPVSADELLALSALGLMGGMATLLLNLAYQQAPASLLASIDYLAVPGSLVGGFLFWSEIPTWQALAGCSVILGAGIVSVGCGGSGGRMEQPADPPLPFGFWPIWVRSRLERYPGRPAGVR